MGANESAEHFGDILTGYRILVRREMRDMRTLKIAEVKETMNCPPKGLFIHCVCFYSCVCSYIVWSPEQWI